MVSFSGRHYPKFIILQCVRWYVSYALSYRNIEEMMKERGFEIDHATLNRWVLHYAPLLEEKSRKYKYTVERSWRMDETYIKIKGKWCYLYRAVDKFGKTVEFMISKKRDGAAAKAFFRKAFRHNRITTPMGCFRKMHTAARTIAGIELMNMIKKNQLNFTKHIDQNLTPAQQFYRLATI